MEVLQKEQQNKGMFYVQEGDEVLAQMTYVWAGTDKIIIDHTHVDDRLKGKGIGKQMLVKAVAFAREKKISIVPLCPFAKSVFDKFPEYRDVL